MSTCCRYAIAYMLGLLIGLLIYGLSALKGTP